MIYVKSRVIVKNKLSKEKMSEKSDRIFLKGNFRKKVFGNGGSILNVSFDVAQLVELVNSLNEERKNRGLDETSYINIVIKEKDNVDKFNNTHYAVLDPWIPEGKSKPVAAEKPASGGKPSFNKTGKLPF